MAEVDTIKAFRKITRPGCRCLSLPLFHTHLAFLLGTRESHLHTGGGKRAAQTNVWVLLEGMARCVRLSECRGLVCAEGVRWLRLCSGEGLSSIVRVKYHGGQLVFWGREEGGLVRCLDEVVGVLVWVWVAGV